MCVVVVAFNFGFLHSVHTQTQMDPHIQGKSASDFVVGFDVLCFFLDHTHISMWLYALCSIWVDLVVCVVCGDAISLCCDGKFDSNIYSSRVLRSHSHTSAERASERKICTQRTKLHIRALPMYVYTSDSRCKKQVRATKQLRLFNKQQLKSKQPFVWNKNPKRKTQQN